MVALGVLNGRMKDYYDLWAIPRAIDISADDLDAAIRATFERRSQRNAHQASLSRCLATKGSSGNGVLTPHRSN